MPISQNVSHGCGAWLGSFVLLTLIGWACTSWFGISPGEYWGDVLLTVFALSLVFALVRWLIELRNPDASN